jgi:Na+-transporting NADH:ubiquinone oxidoreductase subunit NqrB
VLSYSSVAFLRRRPELLFSSVLFLLVKVFLQILHKMIGLSLPPLFPETGTARFVVSHIVVCFCLFVGSQHSRAFCRTTFFLLIILFKFIIFIRSDIVYPFGYDTNAQNGAEVQMLINTTMVVRNRHFHRIEFELSESQSFDANR